MLTHRITESPVSEGTHNNPTPDSTQDHPHSNPISESSVQMVHELQHLSAMITDLGSLFHAHHPSPSGEEFSWYPTWISPVFRERFRDPRFTGGTAVSTRKAVIFSVSVAESDKSSALAQAFLRNLRSAQVPCGTRRSLSHVTHSFCLLWKVGFDSFYF